MKRKVFLCLLIVLGIFFCFPTGSSAENMNSDSYQIQFGNFNITSGKKSSGSYTVTDTVGQTAPGQFGQNGFVVKSGFQYIYTIGTFAFSISNTLIDLGELTPGSFSTGSTVLTVSAKGAGGYTVTAYENAPLTRSTGGATIPDTTCDSGCNQATATLWTNPTNVGFGYNMSGNDIPAAFINASYFKQFADYSSNEPPQVVMSSPSVGKNRQATVTFKATIGGNQTAGTYENKIVFIATPGY